MKYNLPSEWRAQLLDERRKATEAASAFERLCKEHQATLLYECAKLLDESLDGWRLAFKRAAKIQGVSEEIQEAFIRIWVERKHLPLRIGNRRVVSNGLRVLMPGNYSGAPLTLFRGAGAHERHRRIYGFSWSKDALVPRTFARHAAQLDPGGVVLKTLAPPEAILLIRRREDYSDDEDEVVVDPFRLTKVEVSEHVTPANLQQGEARDR
jgi:hypothetical protein